MSAPSGTASRLKDLRARARAELARTPPPPKGGEIWKRMELSSFALDRFAPVEAAALPFEPEAALRAERAGAELLSLEEAARRHPGLVAPFLEAPRGAGEYRALEWASLAGWSGGAFLRVPAGVGLDEPVALRFAAREGFSCPRALIFLEPGARATVVEEHVGEGVGIAFSSLRLGEGSRLGYFYSQRLGSGASHFWHQDAELAQDAFLRHDSALLGARRHKSELDVRLLGAGARSELKALALGEGDRLFDARTSQRHAAPRTSSDLLFRAALKDRSRCAYTGLIRVEKRAEGSDAYQANHTLLLSDAARADTTPILEILTDSVRCKHGATAGPLDPEALFYLAARGFSPEAAARMLVLGFFEPILHAWPGAGSSPAGELEARL